jgi:hypothetical protein
MCKRNGKFVDHLLLHHCEVACAIWNVFFNRFGLSWVMPRPIVDLYACWWTFGSTRNMIVRKMVPRVFYGVYSGKEMIKSFGDR